MFLKDVYQDSFINQTSQKSHQIHAKKRDKTFIEDILEFPIFCSHKSPQKSENRFKFIVVYNKPNLIVNFCFSHSLRNSKEYINCSNFQEENEYIHYIYSIIYNFNDVSSGKIKTLSSEKLINWYANDDNKNFNFNFSLIFSYNMCIKTTYNLCF